MAILGDGWFRGALVENMRRNRYGTRLGLLCQLELTHPDGSTTVGRHRRRVASDDGTDTQLGPLRR